MTWRFPRQAVRALPAPAQLLIRRGRAALQQDDWASPIRALRLREQDYLDRTAEQFGKLPGRRRFLFFALQQVPPWLEVEYSLAVALRLRGHDIRGILCDGLLPLCEMNLGRTERPPCEACVGWLTRHEDAFGFRFTRLSEFVSTDDRTDAERRVRDTPDDELAALVVEGVDVGRLAARELQRYHRGFVFDPPADPAYRQWLVAAVLLVHVSNRLLDREAPDIVFAASGRTLLSACLCAVTRARSIRAVTWDTEPTFPDGLVFSHDEAAALIPVDRAWREASQQPLTCEQRETLRAFSQRWARSEITPYPYNPASVDDHESIRARLGLRPEAPMVVAFGNGAWDMAAVDRDAGFSSMFAWLFALVDHAKAHPEIDLVIRAHPAETNVPPDLRSKTPIGAEILKHAGPLPRHIKLIDGASPIDSYALADMARVVTVYSSRIGLEVALRGRKPWVAGETTYRGKGFTRDVESGQE